MQKGMWGRKGRKDGWLLSLDKWGGGAWEWVSRTTRGEGAREVAASVSAEPMTLGMARGGRTRVAGSAEVSSLSPTVSPASLHLSSHFCPIHLDFPAPDFSPKIRNLRPRPYSSAPAVSRAFLTPPLLRRRCGADDLCGSLTSTSTSDPILRRLDEHIGRNRDARAGHAARWIL